MGGAPERRVDPEVITSSSGVNVNDDTKSLKAPNINTEKRKVGDTNRNDKKHRSDGRERVRGHRHSDVDGGSRSLDWFPKYKKAATDDSSKFYPSTASSSYTSSGGSKFNSSSDRARDVQSIPGLGDFDYPVLDKPPTETSRPKYTSECASNILLQFGLEKEDLEYLVSYPDDQMTPANLPFILRQIRNQKAKRSSTAVESGPYPATRPIRGMSGMGSLSSSGGSSAVLQPAKVIDYGHTGNYAGGVVDEIGRTSGSGGSGSLSLVDTRDSRSHHSQDRTEVKSSALGSSRGQGSSVTNSSYNSVMRSVAPLSSDPAQRLKTPLGSSSLPRKESDRTVYMSVASKSHPSKEPGPQSASKSQPPCTLFRSVHPDRPSLVLIGSNETIDTENRRVTQGKGSSVAEQKQTQMPQNQPQMQQRQMLLKPTKQKQSQLQQNQSQLQQNQKQQSQRQQNQRQLNQKQQNQKQQNQRQQNQRQQNQRQQKQTQQKQPASLMGRAMRPLDFSAAQSVPPAPVIRSNTERSGFVPLSCAIPPLQSVQRQDPAKRPVAKGLPARFMVYDYAAVTPKVFPHTCTLCCKECTSIKHRKERN
ncbi:hypothetical protein F2P81_018124 [Scophthalmus maximus]|uniref:Uncharacterized protein n=1 Tax=Scophthalmus maximus TaxID=52904 RepID=A0A6A4S8Y9_SCOMX|nr:hypothetical protein F2P81_018124 [Scophthalmus maximus]